jgi:hypothetical protein
MKRSRQEKAWRGRGLFLAALLVLTNIAASVVAGAAASVESPRLAAALPQGRWKLVEGSVDRALAWLAAQQAADGSFMTTPAGQPAVTSLCVMAFLSRGHQPGYGPYGAQLDKAVDFVISCQMADGLFSYVPPEAVHYDKRPSHTAVYNHAIAGLMLGEVYGHVTGQRMRDTKTAIMRALQFTRDLQTRPKPAYDKGGWRYLRLYEARSDADLSVTAWQLMFLRSARNAEFDVPQQYIDDAMGFVHRCWNPSQSVFNYELGPSGVTGRYSRGVTGAGIVSMSLAGEHQSPMALAAGDWLLAHPFRGVGDTYGENDRSFYSMYYCSQAALQLGGRYWQGIFPSIVNTLLGSQNPDGSWPPESRQNDGMFGNCYTTALAVLALTPPYQLLPVYQR